MKHHVKIMSNRIRQISVEQVVNKQDSEGTNFISMVYFVGLSRPFTIDGNKVIRTISEIIETEKGFKIYITNDNTTQEWIELYNKERVTKYNFID